jgi:hypothetical protein
VTDSLTYYGALKILGTPKSRLVTLLDAVATAGLAAWAAGALATGRDAAVPVDLIHLKAEVVRYGHDIVRRVSEWRSGLSRFDRSQRLAAAHAVLVISSYFESLEQADMPIQVDRLALSGAEQAALAAGKELPEGYVGMIELLLREPLPMPEPHLSYTDVRRQVADCYTRLSSRLLDFVSGLELWNELNDRDRARMREAINDLSAMALKRYDEGYRNLAADNREFEIWAGLTEVRALGNSLARMSLLLTAIAERQPGQRPRVLLHRSYQAALSEPIIGSGEAPEGVVLPSLDNAYVNPVCRVAEIGPNDRPAEGEWWDAQELVPDIEAFLAGYLTSPRAVTTPLVVLGEPGSGKSKFTEVLAARLPQDDFLPVLVELRDVAAESMVQQQIEQAIYRGPGERVSWHDLIDAAGKALPVVLLDGFDELVQAAAVNRYDYLEQVRDFQLRQAQIGRPVAVVVTTRTVVADQARFPAGSLALQLQPFTEDQVRYWLKVWDRHNGPALAARGLRPLPAEVALAHGELARQPLLLLMLAMFDTADNGLQRAEAPIGRAELYERLLTDFALREVGKSARNRSLPTSDQRELAEHELQRLAVVALAMFARGRQAASDAELNQDLPLLFPESETSGSPDTNLTPAQRAVGRFFFVHKSEARSHDERARSYEFLHTTFGEYFVARLALSALRDLAARREVTRRGMTATGRLDDGFLYAVLSFSCLAARAPIVSFLKELLNRLPDTERAQCREMLPELITGSLITHPSRSFQEYEPVRHTIPRRLASYSANLITMLVLLADEVSTKEFTSNVDTAKNWAQYGYLWRSALTSAEWDGLIGTIRAKVSRTGDSIDIRLRIEDGSPVSPVDSVVVTERSKGLTHFDVHLSPYQGISYAVDIQPSTTAGQVFRNIAFYPEWHTSILLMQTIPSIHALGGDARLQVGEDTLVLPGHLLAQLDYSHDTPADEKLRLYEFCLNNAGSPAMLEQLLFRLSHDVPHLPPHAVIGLLRQLASPPISDIYVALLNELWQRIDSDTDRQSILTLVDRIRTRYSTNPLPGLSPDLSNAISPP